MKKLGAILCLLLAMCVAMPMASAQATPPVKLTVLMHGISQMSGVQDDTVTKAIEERLGIVLDVISDSGMDLNMQLNAMIASDDLPDIIVAMTPEQRQLLKDSDVIIPLDELVDNYGQEISNKAAGQVMLNYSRKFYGDGENLYFVNLRAGEDYEAGLPTVAPFIRWDIYEMIGSPQINNLDDLLNVLKQMQDAYPQTEDGKKVYAISGCLADPGWNTFSLTSAEAFFGYRKLDNYGLAGTKTSDVTQYLNFMENADSPTWQIFKFFNKAYQMGILDPDCVTMKYDQWAEKITAGQVLYVPFGWFANIPIMNDENKVFLPARFDEFINDSFTCSYAYSQGQIACAISKSCKYPELAMQLLNYAWSYDGAYTFANGIQGQDWDYVDGLTQLLDEHAQALKDGKVEAPLFSTFVGPFIDERTGTPIILQKTDEYFQKYLMTGYVKEYCENYGISVPIDNYNTAKYHTWDEAWERGVTAYTGDMKEIDNRIQEYVLTNIPKMVLCESNEAFEQMRLSFMDDLYAMGAQQLIDTRKSNYEQTVEAVVEMQKGE
jgi:putative aldouronate transport system substrate-binding protein